MDRDDIDNSILYKFARSGRQKAIVAAGFSRFERTRIFEASFSTLSAKSGRSILFAESEPAPDLQLPGRSLVHRSEQSGPLSSCSVRQPKLKQREREAGDNGYRECNDQRRARHLIIAMSLGSVSNSKCPARERAIAQDI